MNKKLVSVGLALVLALSLCLVTAVPVSAAPAIIEVEARDLPSITIDGDVTMEEWGDADFIIASSDTYKSGEPGNVGGDVSYDVYIESDDTNLYVAFKYTSGDWSYVEWLCGKDAGGALTAANLYIDANNNDVLDGDDHALSSTWLFEAADGNWANPVLLEGTPVEAGRSWENKVVEYKIPMSLLGIKPGDTIAFACQVFGYGWYPEGSEWTAGEPHEHPEVYAEFMLPPYATIQGAINAAELGDTVNVAAGTYPEYCVLIDKALTVRSTDGAEKTIIDGTGYYVVRIQHSDVTFEGFTVTNPDYQGTSESSILIQNPNAPINNVKILNNIVTKVRSETGTPTVYGATGINLGTGPLSNIVISGNTITNIKNPDGSPKDHTCGINIWDGAENVLISNNDISDIKFNGIMLERASNVRIEGNSITECKIGIRVQPFEEGAVSGLMINFNNIAGNTEYGVANFAPALSVDALYNWWGDETGPSHATLNPRGQGEAVSDDVDFSPWLYKVQEDFISGAPCYAGSVVLSNEATEVETGSYAGGWNTFSTPILLDSSADTWGELLDSVVGSGLSIVRAQCFNLVDGWVFLATPEGVIDAHRDYQIKPGEGFFIQVETKGSLPILCSMELSPPQSWELSLGWNLVGAPSYDSKVVEDGLFSLGATCTVVNSPGANPESWSYPPAAVSKELLPGRAYWVAMSAAGTLMCSESTPVADDLTWELNQ